MFGYCFLLWLVHLKAVNVFDMHANVIYINFLIIEAFTVRLLTEPWITTCALAWEQRLHGGRIYLFSHARRINPRELWRWAVGRGGGTVSGPSGQPGSHPPEFHFLSQINQRFGPDMCLWCSGTLSCPISLQEACARTHTSPHVHCVRKGGQRWKISMDCENALSIFF